MRIICLVAVGVPLSGCAGLQFNPGPAPDALTYNEPIPYFQVTRNGDCTVTGSVVSLPGYERSVAFRNGYGSADLSVNLQNGMIQSVNQKTDSKIPETLTAISSLAGVATKGLKAADAGKPSCDTSAKLYPIRDGKPDIKHPISLSTL
ncbi:hypothetical protein [Bradyrhizobium septentrionale]|uniref:Lipoprotein n=1 Tax=Bradyrhizobium septentrionale TaxID=1404411 RepID=A0A974A104_9BRAD|nr:hypothetical protein [Bradyrhizobium septentrionale]UGY14553.1 hypothetical protein HAP48_0039405 [Bradyrhizobium septentrionale]UGY22729.1 hypothetical protein HU675_0032800 [Bradyrhizobium septentrionale]